MRFHLFGARTWQGRAGACGHLTRLRSCQAVSAAGARFPLPPAVPVVSGSSPCSPALACPDHTHPRAWEVLSRRGFGLHLDGQWRPAPSPTPVGRCVSALEECGSVTGAWRGRVQRTGFGRGVCRPRGPVWKDSSGRSCPRPVLPAACSWLWVGKLRPREAVSPPCPAKLSHRGRGE